MVSKNKRTVLALGLCAGLAIGSTGTAYAGDYAPFVIDGQDADEGEYPATVFLTLVDPATPDEAEICGATLISPEWVLTAAHCTQVTGDTTLIARYGATDLSSEDGVQLEVAEIVDHPDYDPDTLDNDLSLLRLPEEVDGPTMRIVQPGEEDVWSAGTTATLVGWGGLSSDEENQSTPDVLQEVVMQIADDEACAAEIGAGFNADVHFCAGAPEPAPADGPDACRGDSGGPLMVRDEADEWVQVGAVSFGATCGHTLSAYTKLASYAEFIAETTGIDPTPEPEPGASFPDIEGNVHESSILAVADAGITGGYADGTYRPSVAVSRGQMATFLARTLGLSPGDPNRFPDSAGSVHADSIAAVADAGIASGFADGTYRADALVTRAQMATFLKRAAGVPDGPTGSFTDIAGDVHERAIGAIKEAGITTGSADGTYKPNSSVTRDQMATFLFRAFLQDAQG